MLVVALKELQVGQAKLTWTEHLALLKHTESIRLAPEEQYDIGACEKVLIDGSVGAKNLADDVKVGSARL